MMKLLMLMLLVLNPLSIWANQEDSNELGRSIANYQACSKVALDINDQPMFSYYQAMMNDTAVFILSLDKRNAEAVYDIWDNSEAVLLNMPRQHLQKICLSRFDALSRQMLNKIATH